MTIYDNSNIAESYIGTTTPLTFSFASQMYQSVYIHFCHLMGVSNAKIQANQDLYSHMLSFIGYRMYYNLNNWYRLVALLPFYCMNKSYFEKMLGVKSTVTTNESHTFRPFATTQTFIQIIKISFVFLTMRSHIQHFDQKFDRIYNKLQKTNYVDHNSSELLTIFQTHSTQLTQLWNIPIANDFAVMISTGLLSTLWQKWTGSNAQYSNLLTTHQSLASLDPAKQLQKIADYLVTQPKLLAHLTNPCLSEAEKYQTLRTDSQFQKCSDQYLAQYGSRAPNELKLESATLAEHPSEIITLLQNFIQPNSSHNQTTTINWQHLNIFQITILKLIRKWAQISLAYRESTRLKRALIFGTASQVFLQIGHHYTQQKKLNQAQDIFYCHLDEIKTNQLPSLIEIQSRQQQHQQWQTITPPHRLESDKPISQIEIEIINTQSDIPINHNFTTSVSGTVASHSAHSHQISGTPLILTEFDHQACYQDKILITTHTDPGWTIVFPSLKGIIVERGGMLSHAAIVARECGIPCIVGVENASTFLQGAKTITMDLQKGYVYKN